MRVTRAIIAVIVAPLIAAGCAAGGYQGIGNVDRSGLQGGPPNKPGACYAEAVKPPVVKTSYRWVDEDGNPVSGGGSGEYRTVTKVVKQRVRGGGKGEAFWVRPGKVPPNARVIAQRKTDGMLLVVLHGRGGGYVREKTVTKRVPVGGGRPPGAVKREKYEKVVHPPRAFWAEVVCDTPAKAGTIRGVQAKLARLGYYDGPVDGSYNRSLRRAVASYQKRNNLAIGGLTRQTVGRLGVRF